jgi:hypothetical protein
MVECFLDDTDDASADASAEMFGLPVDAVRRILAFEKEARLQRAMQAGLGAVRGIFIKTQCSFERFRATAARLASAADIIRRLDDINRLWPGASAGDDDASADQYLVVRAAK